MLTKDPEDEAESNKEKHALFVLKSSIEPSELIKTGDCQTAKELWKKLIENFEGSRETLTGTVSAERAAFGSKPNEDLFSYCGRFEQLVLKFAMLDYKVPEDQKFYFFLGSVINSAPGDSEISEKVFHP